MKLGIVGLPNVGKSTLFNSLTKAKADAANYPFCTIDPNIGIVPVPDVRLKLLGDLYHSRKVTPAVIEFVDIAGLVKGASKGEGLGNQFLSNIREVDAIVHVVRCFDDPNVVHVDGAVDPARDIETIQLELIFADLEVLERRISKTGRSVANDKSAAAELAILKDIKALLENGDPAGAYEPADEDARGVVSAMNFLTAKPVIYAANVAEADIALGGESPHPSGQSAPSAPPAGHPAPPSQPNPGTPAGASIPTLRPEGGTERGAAYLSQVRDIAARAGSKVFVVCAQIEQELAELDDEEKVLFLEELGLGESGLDKLITASYDLLGLFSFLTAGEDETRAWTIKSGTKAPQAAGKIHSDFERGFIRAEVVNYKDLLDCKTYAAAKEKGLVRLEGKDYVVRDGDVILFRFNV
ncbi:MAG: redox-regulated ATPase YchF [Lachnospiraceae bacterium]|jgi:ribosome-binding ATPase YchF (GTP1/OBG family)|nr:redox-regulated ATPase YchF [Lachnospiraceae bacterium]